MSHHYWGEEDFDWKGLNEAVDMIYDYCVKWGRLGGQSKEKFGQVRFYAMFGLSLHYLFYPGHCFYRFPKWLISFDIYVFTPVCDKLKISWLWVRWQGFIYRQAYKRAVKKFPHLRDEILCAADQQELLKGL